MQSTVQLFQRMYNNLPPLFPEVDRRDMKISLEHLSKDEPVTIKDIEDTMIRFGYLVWPWDRAFRDMVLVNEQRILDHFIWPRLSENTRMKLEDFLGCNGTLEDIKAGRAALCFSYEEQAELNMALTDAARDLKEYTARQVLSTDKKQYLRKVDEYTVLLKSIISKLEDMNTLAVKEEDHPALAEEIRARVRAFEYGLCCLGPEVRHEEINSAVDFFIGRKRDLNRMKGIHTTVAFSWDE